LRGNTRLAAGRRASDPQARDAQARAGASSLISHRATSESGQQHRARNREHEGAATHQCQRKLDMHARGPTCEPLVYGCWNIDRLPEPLRAIGRKQPLSQRGLELAVPGGVEAAGRQISPDLHSPGQRVRGGYVADPGEDIGGEPPALDAQDASLAARGGDEIHEHLQRRGLARPDRADERVDLTFGHRHAQSPQHLLPSQSAPEVFGAHDVVRHGFPPPEAASNANHCAFTVSTHGYAGSTSRRHRRRSPGPVPTGFLFLPDPAKGAQAATRMRSAVA
jgi:hypothetical protein